MLYVHIGIASMRQFRCVPTTYLTEMKETYFEIFTKIDFASFKHLKLPIRTKIPANRLYLHDSFITKLDFMNCAFAKLLLAWL